MSILEIDRWKCHFSEPFKYDSEKFMVHTYVYACYEDTKKVQEFNTDKQKNTTKELNEN